MFEIFLKKEQYSKVSSKFKDHFEQRDSRVDFVTSKETKIEEKMQIFKSLINDDVKLQKKSSIIKASYFREKKKEKANELQSKEIHDLSQMADGLIEWNNLKQHKCKQKENIFSWNNYREEKQERKKKHETNFGDMLKEKLNLMELRLTHRTEKFQTQVRAKLQNSILQKDSNQPFHLTYRNSPQKDAYMHELYKKGQKNKYKLAKYFAEMKEFSCRKNDNSENLFHGKNAFQPLESMKSTAYCTPFSYQRSGTFTPCEHATRYLESKQSTHFRDDKIYPNMKNRFSLDEIEQETHSSVPIEEMSILNKNEKVKMVTKSLDKLRKLPLCRVNSGKLCREKVVTEETVKDRNVFRTVAKCPFDIKKLNAVKKIQCL